MRCKAIRRWIACFALGVVPIQAIADKIPLCAGLTIVTAISQRDGDYESIKTVESDDGETLRLKYSSEQPLDGTKIRRLSVSRVLRVSDLRDAHLYLQVFQNTAPSTVPGTTAIGTSRAVLAALKSKGEAELGIFDLPNAPLSADPENHPSLFDYQRVAKIKRVEVAPVLLTMIVNDVKTQLPAIHAIGDYDGDKAEFYFLDDDTNPLALKYQIAGASSDGTLQVIKIAYQCTAPPVGASRLERALAENKRAAVYSIYFSFNSDQPRPESDPTLKELGELLRRHADWKLTIEGHTDAIGGDEKNLDLSKRRSAAVKTALVGRYQVDASRLSTTGYGKSQPKDTNDTPEGRARNRRVELVRE
jgi:outer membrane protein OmpA-like peptidoglycan-associated protein